MTYIARNVLNIELKGTEKQCNWGKTIRAQKVAFFERLGNRAVLKELLPLLVEGEVNAMNAMHPVRLGWLATYTVVMALSKNDARYWIDHRDEDPVKWLRPAYGDVLLYLIHHPFPDA
jgi:hypothetical protein